MKAFYVTTSTLVTKTQAKFSSKIQKKNPHLLLLTYTSSLYLVFNVHVHKVDKYAKVLVHVAVNSATISAKTCLYEGSLSEIEEKTISQLQPV